MTHSFDLAGAPAHDYRLAKVLGGAGGHRLGGRRRIRRRHQFRLDPEPRRLSGCARPGAVGDVRDRHPDAAQDLSLRDVLAGHAARRLEICVDRAQPRRAGRVSRDLSVVGDRARRGRRAGLCLWHLSRPGGARLQPGGGCGIAVAGRPSRLRSRRDLGDLCGQRRRGASLRAVRHGAAVRDRRRGTGDLRDRLFNFAGGVRRRGEPGGEGAARRAGGGARRQLFRFRRGLLAVRLRLCRPRRRAGLGRRGRRCPAQIAARHRLWLCRSTRPVHRGGRWPCFTQRRGGRSPA